MSCMAAVSCSQAPSSEIDQKVEALLSKMTLQEKIGQMNQINTSGNVGGMSEAAKRGEIGSILNEVNPEVIRGIQKIAVEESRLGIPILIARDVIHGYKTIFPIPLGQAATFNPQLVEEGARISAKEATSVGIRWTFSPMVDISRDARWGRIAESSGEDSYLASLMGAAMVRGYQTEDLSNPTAMAACTKHFIGYGAAEGGRDYSSTFLTERQLRNTYFLPFKAAAEAGSATFMTSFNENDGIPATANKFVISDVLKGEWNFKGFVVSDWASTVEMVEHGYAENNKHAAELALNAGLDMEMVAGSYLHNIEQLLEEGKVKIETIDSAVRNILRVKFQLGLFENPYAPEQQENQFYKAEYLAAAKQAAEESLILLKNSNNTLPLAQKGQTIAIVGPLADAPYEQMGTWVFDGEKEHTVTPLAAIKEKYGKDNKIIFESGLTYSRDRNMNGVAKAVKATRAADVVVVFVGEESILSGEAHSLADISLQGAQSELIEAIKKSGKKVVTVVMSGRPMTIGRDVDNSDAVLYSFHPGTMGGPAIADILFGKSVPSGKTPSTFPKMVGQIPIYYNQANTGRPATRNEPLIEAIPIEAGQTSLGCTAFYMDAGFDPLFPFGFGLSYANFEYGDVVINKKSYSQDENIEVKVTIKNSSKYDGYEVAQLYIRDHTATAIRPVKELKRFEKVLIKAGESKEVSFSLPVADLAFYNGALEYVVEPGKFSLWVATDSASGSAIELLVN
ncbi:MAG: beta-glucosidase BglX [Rikenellaceae bacterium]